MVVGLSSTQHGFLLWDMGNAVDGSREPHMEGFESRIYIWMPEEPSIEGF